MVIITTPLAELIVVLAPLTITRTLMDPTITTMTMDLRTTILDHLVQVRLLTLLHLAILDLEANKAGVTGVCYGTHHNFE